MFYILAFIGGLIIVLLLKPAINDNKELHNDNKELYFLKYSNGDFVLDSNGNKIPSNAENEALIKKDYISPYQKKLIERNNKTRKKTNGSANSTKSGRNNNCQIRKKNGRFG